MLQIIPNQKAQIITVLSNLRREWEDAAAGESLLNMEGNVGLFLADIVNAFGFSSHELMLVLGIDLYTELQEILPPPPLN